MENYSNRASWAISLILLLITLFFLTACDKDNDGDNRDGQVYTGDQFPGRYKNAALMAFHGSWKGAPWRQGSHFFVFVPMSNGLPSGDGKMFAEGFTGVDKEPDQAQYRPMGLAQGPDGYVSDSKREIWRIIYKG